MTALATDGPLRMITQGQELTIDYDERTLYDMGFKDNQVTTPTSICIDFFFNVVYTYLFARNC